MTKSSSAGTEAQWTAAMASEDHTSAGLDAHVRAVVVGLREQGGPHAQLADAIESGRVVVQGGRIVDPTNPIP
jgi:hypothetical protein